MQPVGARAQGLARVLGPALVVLGLVAAVVGVGTTFDATRDSTGGVDVPVRLRASDGRGAWLRLEVAGELYPGAEVVGVPTGGLPTSDNYSHPIGMVTLRAPGATLAEQVLSRGDDLLRGLALLVAAFALRPVLGALADGRALRPGHERHVQVVAACVVVGGYVGPLLPWAATASVLRRLDDAHGLSATPVHHVEAVVVAALVVLVGAVIRAGTAGTAPGRP